jgi:hypothetical protein
MGQLPYWHAGTFCVPTTLPLRASGRRRWPGFHTYERRSDSGSGVRGGRAARRVRDGQRSKPGLRGPANPGVQAVEELQDRGLVDVKQSSPKQFWAISAETATRTFEHELERRMQVLRAALTELEPAERRSEQGGVWTVDGQSAITQRVLEFFGSAEEEIVYMTVEDLLTEDLIEGLSEAAERGVSVKLAGISPQVQERIQDDIPDATIFESLWVWSDTPAGRLMMVDRQKTLVSAFVNGAEDDPSDPRSETAIWGEGDTNSLVVVLRALFAWRLESVDPDS